MRVYTFLKKRYVSYAVVLVSLSYTSCSQSEDKTLGNYQQQTIKIDPNNVTDGLKLDQYSVDSVCSLSFPNGIELHEITKFVIKNERIYIMDSRLDKTIFVFDSFGKYLFKAGERGRAKNEYIDGPQDFFVDDDNNIHVFDNRAKKILIFNNMGKLSTVIDVMQYFPRTFGMKADKNYLFEFNFDKDEENTVLAECDEKNTIKSKLLHRLDKYYFYNEQTFFANDKRLSHIPIMADSVLVFNNDTLEKVVKFDFGGKFLMIEHPSLVLNMHSPKEISAYKGVRYLQSYQETENLILLDYVYQSNVNFWLFNKRTKKSVIGPFIFDGLSPFHNYFIKDNQIITIVCEEAVSIDETDTSFNKDIFERNYKTSSKQLQDIYDGKTKLPAIVYISIK